MTHKQPAADGGVALTSSSTGLVPEGNSPAPFALKPLVGGIPADGEAFTNYQLDNQAGGFPTGTAVIN